MKIPPQYKTTSAANTKVLHIIPGIDPSEGGVVASVNGLARAQHSQGINVSVFTTFKQGDDFTLLHELVDCGVNVYKIGPTRTPIENHPDLRISLEQAIQQADVIHVHALWRQVQYLASKICQSQNKPYIVSPHGMLDPWSLTQNALRKKIYWVLRARRNYNNANFIHCSSQIESELLETLKLKPKHLVEPNGIDMTEFEMCPPKGHFRKRYPQTKGKRIVLFLSRLHHKKGLDILITAFAKANFDDCILVLAGPCEKSYKKTLEEFVEKAGLDASEVLFAGMQRGPERIEAYCDADLFVLPSYQENFGIVVIESLAAGTPVLISDQVNIWPDIKKAGVGVICATSVSSLSNSLKQILGSSASISIDARKCINFVTERYEWKSIAQRWVHHLKHLSCE